MRYTPTYTHTHACTHTHTYTHTHTHTHAHTHTYTHTHTHARMHAHTHTHTHTHYRLLQSLILEPDNATVVAQALEAIPLSLLQHLTKDTHQEVQYQWNLSDLDTNGVEVSSFQRLKQSGN